MFWREEEVLFPCYYRHPTNHPKFVHISRQGGNAHECHPINCNGTLRGMTAPSTKVVYSGLCPLACHLSGLSPPLKVLARSRDSAVVRRVNTKKVGTNLNKSIERTSSPPARPCMLRRFVVPSGSYSLLTPHKFGFLPMYLTYGLLQFGSQSRSSSKDAFSNLNR